MKEMLDAMATGLLRILLDGEEPVEPQRTPSNEWRCVYQEPLCQEARSYNPHVVLEVVGESINPRRERRLERKFRRTLAAGVIQKVVRGFLVRNQRRSLVRSQAAVKIQCKVRQCLAKLTLARLRRDNTAALLAEGETLRSSRKASEGKVLVAVLRIQKHYKAHRARTRLRSLRRHKAEITIAKSISVLSACLKVAQARKRLRSVKLLQAAWRRRLVCRMTCAGRIQAAWMAYRRRRQFTRALGRLRGGLVVGRTVEANRARRAFKLIQGYSNASVIAAVVKSFMAYKLTEQLRAVLAIQCGVRAWLGRRQQGRLEARGIVAATYVQKLCRGYLEREKYLVPLQQAAATAIQKAFKGSLCRSHLAILKQRHAAAATIQRFLRGRQHARLIVETKLRTRQELERARLSRKLRLEAKNKIAEVVGRLSAVDATIEPSKDYTEREHEWRTTAIPYYPARLEPRPTERGRTSAGIGLVNPAAKQRRIVGCTALDRSGCKETGGHFAALRSDLSSEGGRRTRKDSRTIGRKKRSRLAKCMIVDQV
jgi:hypothetical protein